MEIPGAPRALASERVRYERLSRSSDPHVVPINQLVDRISVDRGAPNLPLIDPTFGGVGASVLLVLKAPEADADPSRRGRRFLSLDNDDAVAARMFATCVDVGLHRGDLVAWNICPFPIARSAPSAAELADARPYTARLLAMLPRLRGVVLLGSPAQKGWESGGFGSVTDAVVFRGASPSPPGINQQRNRESYEAAMAGAADLIR